MFELCEVRMKLLMAIFVCYDGDFSGLRKFYLTHFMMLNTLELCSVWKTSSFCHMRGCEKHCSSSHDDARGVHRWMRDEKIGEAHARIDAPRCGEHKMCAVGSREGQRAYRFYAGVDFLFQRKDAADTMAMLASCELNSFLENRWDTHIRVIAFENWLHSTWQFDELSPLGLLWSLTARTGSEVKLGVARVGRFTFVESLSS